MATPGRKPLEISIPDFQFILSELETEQKFTTRSSLWEAFAQTDWAKNLKPRPLTAQNAMLLAKKHNLTIQTPIGQRGRVKGCGPVPGGGRKKKTLPENIVEVLAKVVPEKYIKVLNRVKQGSMKAAVKLKCLDCCGFEKKEITLCNIQECSLWSHRPYQPRVVNRATPLEVVS